MKLTRLRAGKQVGAQKWGAGGLHDDVHFSASTMLCVPGGVDR